MFHIGDIARYPKQHPIEFQMLIDIHHSNKNQEKTV